MPKACIVTYDEYINIPYVKDYEKILMDNNIEYDFIFWQRNNDANLAYIGDNAYVFTYKTRKSKLSKLLPFYLWRRFARKVIINNNYDFLVVCTTIPAILLTDILTKKYRKKYLLDIRDYTYENICLFRKLENRILDAAGMIVVSSKGFLDWLSSEYEYVLTHNISL